MKIKIIKNYEKFFFGNYLIPGILIVTLGVLLVFYFSEKNNETQTVSSLSGHDGLLHKEIKIEDKEEEEESIFIPTIQNVNSLVTFADLQKYLWNIDESAYVSKEDLDITKLLSHDFKTDLQGGEPKILIFHTHSQEDFIDSKEGVVNDTIVGVGTELARILAEKYNIPVVHDIGKYDFKDGKENRDESYQNMEPAVISLLEKYPSVEIAIDLHRDGVSDNIKFATVIDGKPTAKIMFFNGITRINNGGKPKEIEDLINPYLEENLALSLQMQLTANELYSGFTRKMYVKPYRYSLHLLPKSMLVEVGANTSTVEEAKNAMEPLAEILVKVLDSDVY